MHSHNPGAPGDTNAATFETTRWSVVLAAGGRASPQSEQALARLCACYWSPLYAYVRRRGFSADAAQDLTQAFFARLLEKKTLSAATRERGKFRCFLLASMKHFLANEWDRSQAQKRGGKVTLVSFDAAALEQRYAGEASYELSPERLFDRRWAVTLLQLVLDELRRELIAEGKERFFDRVKQHLTGEESELSYRELGIELGMSEAALKVAIHRLRRRYGKLLHEHIAQTVASAAEVEDELRHLLASVSS
jgi:RNA polymerase sigma-70 factor (ECF subfamily)